MSFCFVFFQFVESVSYRLEDLKSGTVKVRSLFIYMFPLINQIKSTPLIGLSRS